MQAAGRCGLSYSVIQVRRKDAETAAKDALRVTLWRHLLVREFSTLLHSVTLIQQKAYLPGADRIGSFDAWKR